MDYQSILKVVKEQNVGMSHKEAQKKASEMLKKFAAAQEAFAAAQEAFASNSVAAKEEPAMLNSKLSGTVPQYELIAIEKRIRQEGVNISRIALICRELIPDGEIVNHGRDGVNTRITWQDNAGNRVPVDGYFVVWI